MNTEELLRAGITAANAGDVTKAIKLLAEVVQADPNSELGWLWLGLCISIVERREYCFRRVLSINPQNIEAKRQLELLHKPAVNIQSKEPQNPPRNPQVISTPQFVKAAKSHPLESQKRDVHSRVEKTVQHKKNDSMYIWLSVGIVLLICTGIAGVIVLGRMA